MHLSDQQRHRRDGIPIAYEHLGPKRPKCFAVGEKSSKPDRRRRSRSAHGHPRLGRDPQPRERLGSRHGRLLVQRRRSRGVWFISRLDNLNAGRFRSQPRLRLMRFPRGSHLHRESELNSPRSRDETSRASPAVIQAGARRAARGRIGYSESAVLLLLQRLCTGRRACGRKFRKHDTA